MICKLSKLIPIFLGLLTFYSCSNLSECSDTVLSYVPCMDYFTPSPLTTVKIRSTKCTNGGTPFYALIKPSDYPTFLTDDYFKMAHMVAHPPEDLPSFGTCCIVPGIDQTIEIETPEANSIGVYFLFTQPGDVWKAIFELEGSSQTIKIMLDGNQIISANKN